MKKTIALLLLMSMLLALCAACGGSKEDTSAPAVPDEPVAAAEVEEDLPTVQRNTDANTNNDNGMIAAEENIAAGSVVNTNWLETLSEEQRYVEENLIGTTLEDLIAYLGEPRDEEYHTSCLVSDGLDGILYYNGFYVSTTRYPSGEEIVMGTVEN